VHPPALFAPAPTRKNVKRVQKLEKLRHDKQCLTLIGFCLISVMARVVEYPDLFVVLSGASICPGIDVDHHMFPGPMLQGGRKRTRQEGKYVCGIEQDRKVS
jgi:hypothetical protein